MSPKREATRTLAQRAIRLSIKENTAVFQPSVMRGITLADSIHARKKLEDAAKAARDALYARIRELES